MGFGIDDLNDGQREALAELTEDQAVSVIRVLMGRFGYVGTYFQKDDVESVVNRSITDDEWEKVQNSWYWYKGIPDSLSMAGWDLVHEAVRDAGLSIEEDDDE